MASWKTYLVMYFGSGTKLVSDIVKEVEKIGFKATLGTADFIYNWVEKPTKDEVIKLADKLSQVLSGTGAIFNLETHD